MASLDSLIEKFKSKGGWWLVPQAILFVLYFCLPVRRETFPHPAVIQIAGIVLLVAGGALIISGIWMLRRSLTPFPEPLPSARLITTGPFRFVRHPIYGGIIIMALGWAAANGDGLRLINTILLLLFFFLKTENEEARLMRIFPDEYPGYRKRTYRLIPWVI